MWPQVPWHLGEILLTADVPNKAARDMLANGLAPLLEQPPESNRAVWPGCKQLLAAGFSADARETTTLFARGEEGGAN